MKTDDPHSSATRIIGLGNGMRGDDAIGLFVARRLRQETDDRVQVIEAGAMDDVIMGCAMPEGAQGLNMGRIIALRAGLTGGVPATSPFAEGSRTTVIVNGTPVVENAKHTGFLAIRDQPCRRRLGIETSVAGIALVRLDRCQLALKAKHAS